MISWLVRILWLVWAGVFTLLAVELLGPRKSKAPPCGSAEKIFVTAQSWLPLAAVLVQKDQQRLLMIGENNFPFGIQSTSRQNTAFTLRGTDLTTGETTYFLLGKRGNGQPNVVRVIAAGAHLIVITEQASNGATAASTGELKRFLISPDNKAKPIPMSGDLLPIGVDNDRNLLFSLEKNSSTTFDFSVQQNLHIETIPRKHTAHSKPITTLVTNGLVNATVDENGNLYLLRWARSVTETTPGRAEYLPVLEKRLPPGYRVSWSLVLGEQGQPASTRHVSGSTELHYLESQRLFHIKLLGLSQSEDIDSTTSPTFAVDVNRGQVISTPRPLAIVAATDRITWQEQGDQLCIELAPTSSLVGELVE